jgi:hypothetical protein
MRSSPWLGLAQRKHCFVYCCIIVGACFDVTVLAWRKYTTIYMRFLGNGAGSEVLELGQIKLLRSEDHSKMTKVKFHV